MRFLSYLKAYQTREDGGILIFSLMIFVMIILVGGVAVDMKRYESERIRIQGTADRAVLAAATMRESASNLTPVEVVQAYFDAEGLGDFVRDRVEVIEVGGTRSVRVMPQARVPTLFMRLAGVDHLDMNLVAAASESLAEIKFEIVLVLDVSISMNMETSSGRTRMEELQDAAHAFLDLIFESTPAESLAITIVPYDRWVLPPAGFVNHFTNLSNPDHTGACIDFVVWDDVTNSIDTPVERKSCPTDAWRLVRPMINELQTARDIITDLIPAGNTSIDLGVRFGGLFFDPSMRPALDQMIDNHVIDEDFRGFPKDWNEPLYHRALILMTDGYNCCSHFVARQVPDREVWDARTVDTCQSLIGNGVTIYSVAFEVSADDMAMMEQCASSPSHFFNGSGGQLLNAFQSIATHIQTSAVRLTQ
jgi:hypothetical protein